MLEPIIQFCDVTVTTSRIQAYFLPVLEGTSNESDICEGFTGKIL